MAEIQRTRETDKLEYQNVIPPTTADAKRFRTVLVGTLMNSYSPDLLSARTVAGQYLERYPDGRCLIYMSQETLVEEIVL